jgi:hypothetical protein
LAERTPPPSVFYFLFYFRPATAARNTPIGPTWASFLNHPAGIPPLLRAKSHLRVLAQRSSSLINAQRAASEAVLSQRSRAWCAIVSESILSCLSFWKRRLAIAAVTSFRKQPQLWLIPRLKYRPGATCSAPQSHRQSQRAWRCLPLSTLLTTNSRLNFCDVRSMNDIASPRD